ncbi:MAG: hypothetical protein Q7S13_00535, partial [Candidatus Omnitrophota bacterium]|nr:hypothetical protein [Candidatus Omnitrophota bacterium]
MKNSFSARIIQWTGSLEQHFRLAILAIYCVALLAFSNVFANQFVMDDFAFIVDWPLIQDWKNFPQFFINYTPPPGQEGIYSPLKTVFHAINYHLFGLNPLGYHIVSLAIHLASIWFVIHITLRLTKIVPVALMAGLLFTVHPVHVEAITYLTASIDSLGVLFLLISFYFYVRRSETEGREQQRFYRWSIAFGFLAIFTHELNISLPLLIVWFDFFFKKKEETFALALKRSAPFFLLVGVYVLAKYINLDLLTRGQYIYNSFYLTMLVIVKAWAKYVLICIWPNVLTHNHVISPGIYSFAQDDFDKFAVLSQSLYEPR